MAVNRAAQCRAWNAARDHQVQAGKARAHQFTRQYQAVAGNASYAAFAARFRAEHGSPPLSGKWVARYLTPDQIRGPLGMPLPAPLRAIIHQAWCSGLLVGIEYWLGEPDPNRLPGNSLWAVGRDDHAWQPVPSTTWASCADCSVAAFCPVCAPSWPDDPVLSRLPQWLCMTHQEGG